MKSPKLVMLIAMILGSLLLMGFTVLNLDASKSTASKAPWLDNTECFAEDCEPQDVQMVAQTEAPSSQVSQIQSSQPFSDDSLNAQMLRVADLYEQQSQYPPYSYPIYEGNLSQFLPNRHIPTSLPLRGLGLGDDLSLQLGLDKFQYFWTDIIEASVEANLGEGTDITFARFELVTVDGVSVFSEGQDSDALSITSHQAIARIKLSQISASDEQDFYLIARIRSSNQADDFEIRAPLKISHKAGEVTGVADSYIQDTHLMIPVEVSLNSNGYYLLSANLYSQSGKPLINLSSKGRFSKLDGIIYLKAHYSALAAMNDEGPYQLKDFQLKQLPAKPGINTGFGQVPDQAFEVQGYSFNDYQKSPYIDPNAEARIEFLRSLSGSNG